MQQPTPPADDKNLDTSLSVCLYKPLQYRVQYRPHGLVYYVYMLQKINAVFNSRIWTALHCRISPGTR